MKKKPSNLSRLLGYAEGHRFLLYASWVLSAGSALLALVPFWYIWKILEEVLAVAPRFAQAQHLVEYGWLAVGSSVLAVLVYIAGLMCSHMGAFRVATNLRIQAMEHIVTLPLGLAEAFGSGKSSTSPAEPQRPIWPTSFPTGQGPLPPLAGCWCSSSSLTGGWGC